ncbi:hypothetical protein F511_37991 [Dorcoceras hygrometricum]|uniref:Uncharacterized protein n=1 Tax=Dorcoceras hygrometricum TaxID=472368 RepID=A0A2Z7AYC7_9LAMI|nr:hypothetical protein F511_37991 [Dorcoceras hygrometricum]
MEFAHSQSLVLQQMLALKKSVVWLYKGPVDGKTHMGQQLNSFKCFSNRSIINNDDGVRAGYQISRGNRHFTVDCGRQRQSGPRPETGFLRQTALEGLTRSTQTDSPRQDWPEQIPAARGGCGGGAQGRRPRARLGDGFGSGTTGPGPTDEHSFHLHHRDFIVTPIADQIGRIDSVSKTEYYDLKNHFSEPQCKMTVLPLNSGKSRFDPC